MTNWIARNKKSIIRAAFLVPIFSVAAISISHVVSWYDIANPISWAIYLSIAVEIAAMSAIAASSVRVKGFSVWFVFIIVTLIQFIGNIFFCYSEINIDSKEFKDWSELTAPVFEAMGSNLSDMIAQKRWLALLEGGLLPLISLTCLHFFIQYGEVDNVKPAEDLKPIEEIKTEPISEEVDLQLESQPEMEKDEVQQTEDSTQEEIAPNVQAVKEESTAPNVPTPAKGPQVKKVNSGISYKMKKIFKK